MTCFQDWGTSGARTDAGLRVGPVQQIQQDNYLNGLDCTLLTDPVFRICFLIPLSDSPRVAKSLYQEPHRLQLHDLRFAFRASDSVIIWASKFECWTPRSGFIAKSQVCLGGFNHCIFYHFEVVAFFIWTYVILSTWQTAVSVVPTQAQWNKSVTPCFGWKCVSRAPQVQRLPGGWCVYPKPIGGTMQASQKLVRTLCGIVRLGNATWYFAVGSRFFAFEGLSLFQVTAALLKRQKWGDFDCFCCPLHFCWHRGSFHHSQWRGLCAWRGGTDVGIWVGNWKKSPLSKEFWKDLTVQWWQGGRQQ